MKQANGCAGTCPTCGFPPDEAGWLRSDFPPGHPRFGALIPCPDCHDANLSQRLAQASQLTGILKKATLDNYRPNNGNTAALQAAVSFAERPVGWLTLWGSYGPGKTHLLAAVVNHCAANRTAAVYYTLPDLLDKLREGYGDDGFTGLYERLVSVPVLAIDEVDKVRLTEWATEKIYQLADARYRDLDTRGTLYAMNVEPDPSATIRVGAELIPDPMNYLYSRMRDHRCRIIEVAGGDVRPVEMGK